MASTSLWNHLERSTKKREGESGSFPEAFLLRQSLLAVPISALRSQVPLGILERAVLTAQYMALFEKRTSPGMFAPRQVRKGKPVDGGPLPWLPVLKCLQRGLYISVLLGCCSCGFGGSKGMTKRTARCHPSVGGTLSGNGREGVCCLMEADVSKMLTFVGCRMLRRYFLLLHVSV